MRDKAGTIYSQNQVLKTGPFVALATTLVFLFGDEFGSGIQIAYVMTL